MRCIISPFSPSPLGWRSVGHRIFFDDGKFGGVITSLEYPPFCCILPTPIPGDDEINDTSSSNGTGKKPPPTTTEAQQQEEEREQQHQNQQQAPAEAAAEAGVLPVAFSVALTEVAKGTAKLGGEKGINLPDTYLELPALGPLPLCFLLTTTAAAAAA